MGVFPAVVSAAVGMNSVADLVMTYLGFVGHPFMKIVLTKSVVDRFGEAELLQVYTRLFAVVCAALGIARIAASFGLARSRASMFLPMSSYIIEAMWIGGEAYRGTYNLSFDTPACADLGLLPQDGCDAQVVAGILATVGLMLTLLVLLASTGRRDKKKVA